MALTGLGGTESGCLLLERSSKDGGATVNPKARFAWSFGVRMKYLKCPPHPSLPGGA